MDLTEDDFGSFYFTKNEARYPKVAPVPPTVANEPAPIPAAPIDCSTGTNGAPADIIEAAVEPAAIPPAPKPIPATTTGNATTVVAAAATTQIGVI